MWEVAEFSPSTLFSLRPANATTSGGKTLVTPTAYAVKMALLDVSIRTYGRAVGEAWFSILRDLKVAVALPTHLSILKTFIKVLRPHKDEKLKDVYGTGLEGPKGNTIAYRELVHYGGSLKIAVTYPALVQDGPDLSSLLALIHYLGKRGGFMQWRGHTRCEELGDEFVVLNPDQPPVEFAVEGLLQIVDDCGPEMTFQHADVYSGKSILVGKSSGRILKPIILPFRPLRAARSYTLYERIN